MKFTIDQKSLKTQLGIASNFVSPKSTLPVLANIYLEALPDSLMIEATNLEMGVKLNVAADILKQGTEKAGDHHFTLPGQMFRDIISGQAGDKVTLDLNAKTGSMKISSGESSTSLKGIDGNEFPPMPEVDEKDGVTLKASAWKSMIDGVVHAASSDQARAILMGVLLEINGASISMVATDGYCMSFRSVDLPKAAKSGKVIIGASSLRKLASSLLTNPDEEVTFYVDSNSRTKFTGSGWTFYAIQVDGKFPDWRVFVAGDRSKNLSATIKKSDLIQAIRVADVIARRGQEMATLNRKKADDKTYLEVVAEEAEVGNANYLLPIEGQVLETVSFNTSFLRESVSSLEA